MTPERIEEIKNVAGISDEWALEKIVNELLAALEESQQQLEEEKKWRAVEHEVAGGYHRELIQAHQTIEQYKEILNVAMSGNERPEVYRKVEEMKKEIKS
jgi:hypothetical protein